MSVHWHETFCDLVAKGGVTSGVVYPAAIAKLSQQFSFRNLGGTSVGAIATAAAAAAEFGRRNGGQDNFHRIGALGAELGTYTASGRTRLSTLFQPSHDTTTLFATLTAGVGKSYPLPRLILAMVWRFWPATLLALLLCGLLAWPLLSYPSFSVQLIGAMAAGVITTLTVVVFALGAFSLHAIRVLPKNFYGLCTGRSWPASGTSPALSEWFADFFDQLANLPPGSPPLTFGNLWWPDVASGEKKPEYDPNASSTTEETAARFVNLEMITTCISEGRPYRLPFRQDFDVRENRSFWYKPDELKQFLPDRIVNWMMAHPRQSNRLDAMKAQGYYPLPDPWNFPIVTAVRMSLSFPLLLTAIKLYVSRKGEAAPRICWFSDGGICSNFPIHFFDTPLPEWPTFAINLSDKTSPQQKDVSIAQDMSHGAGLPLTSFDYAYGQGDLQRTALMATTPLQQVIAFAKAIIFTMHNWNDNTQTVLPGNRDRIVIVNLERGEGGLNLNMSQTTITRLNDLGAAAANELLARFGNNTTHPLGLDAHRWVRLKASLSAMEDYLVKLSMSCSEIEKQLNLEKFVTERAHTNYQWHDNQALIAWSVISTLRNLGADLSKKRPLSETAPRPRPELRARPRL